MKMRAYLLLTTIVFALVALVHLVRFAMNWTVMVGTTTIPHSASLIALIVCALLAFWGATLLRRT